MVHDPDDQRARLLLLSQFSLREVARLTPGERRLLVAARREELPEVPEEVLAQFQPNYHAIVAHYLERFAAQERAEGAWRREQQERRHQRGSAGHPSPRRRRGGPPTR